MSAKDIENKNQGRQAIRAEDLQPPTPEDLERLRGEGTPDEEMPEAGEEFFAAAERGHMARRTLLELGLEGKAAIEVVRWAQRHEKDPLEVARAFEGIYRRPNRSEKQVASGE